MKQLRQILLAIDETAMVQEVLKRSIIKKRY